MIISAWALGVLGLTLKAKKIHGFNSCIVIIVYPFNRYTVDLKSYRIS